MAENCGLLRFNLLLDQVKLLFERFDLKLEGFVLGEDICESFNGEKVLEIFSAIIGIPNEWLIIPLPCIVRLYISLLQAIITCTIDIFLL